MSKIQTENKRIQTVKMSQKLMKSRKESSSKEKEKNAHCNYSLIGKGLQNKRLVHR